jgi:Tol biopolymer transport system component
MRRNLFKCLLLATALVLASVVLVGQVEARHWAVESTYFWDVDRVCRDGAEVVAVSEHATNITSTEGIGDARDIQALQYTLGFGPGPMLTEPQPFTLTHHPQPLTDTLADGTITSYYVYTTGTLIWPHVLGVGTTVWFQGLMGTVTGTIQDDCYLNRLALDEGSTIVIGRDHLDVNYGLLRPSDTVYRLNALPAHGLLKLNGASVGVGGFFTQNDINQGRLTYTHDGSDTLDDHFNFTVHSTSRVSIGLNESRPNGDSLEPAISPNGRYVAFASYATNVVSDDTNGWPDIFVYDLATNTTRRMSVASDGTQANGASYSPDLTNFHVAFTSAASNLVPSDTNNLNDIFVGSTVYTGTDRISVTSQGDQAMGGNSASPVLAGSNFGGAEKVVFASAAVNLTAIPETTSYSDIFLRSEFTDRVTNKIGTFIPANGDSTHPDTGRGRDGNQHIAFDSMASDLTVSDTNSVSDIFVNDIGATRVSVRTDPSLTIQPQSNGWSYAPSISNDGRFVAFESLATNLVAITDTNGFFDIYLHDRDPDGNGVFDEGCVPGACKARTLRVSRPKPALPVGTETDGPSFWSAVAGNGQRLAYSSYASNLIDNDTNKTSDIFVYDLTNDDPSRNSNSRVSIAADGTQADGPSDSPAMSDDGSFVAFRSAASNLVANETNDRYNVFVHYIGFTSDFPIAIRPVSEVFLPVILQ